MYSSSFCFDDAANFREQEFSSPCLQSASEMENAVKENAGMKNVGPLTQVNCVQRK